MDFSRIDVSGISIQVSLSGYSFKIQDGAEVRSSGWLGPESLFTTPEFQRRYPRVDISLLTPKCTLVPESFFSEETVRASLAEVVNLQEGDKADYVRLPELGAVLLYSTSIGESLSRVISQTVLTEAGEQVPVLPEMYYLLKTLPACTEYNKIVAAYRDGWLHLVIAQGKSLCLANVFQAADFTTAEYFLFLAMNRLQLNPEVSTVCFRTPLSPEAEMSLYRYFKAVVQL